MDFLHLGLLTYCVFSTERIYSFTREKLLKTHIETIYFVCK